MKHEPIDEIIGCLTHSREELGLYELNMKRGLVEYAEKKLEQSQMQLIDAKNLFEKYIDELTNDEVRSVIAELEKTTTHSERVRRSMT